MSRSHEPFAERAFRFSCAIVKLDVELRKSPRVPEHITRQLLAAGTSIAASLEEAKGAQSRRDVASKFSVALKEAREAAYWLRLLTATSLVDGPQASALDREAHELVAILTVALRRLRNQDPPGRLSPQTHQSG
jgi:four helix bundle protein